jgi:NAD(P)-dependent dehydrogenase (short-subunit alcohol dehydrogenase family)
MKKLQNKTAVVTGASSGMGKAIALLFAEEGANVVLADRNKEGLNEVLKEIQSKGAKAEAIVCDVSVEAEVTHLISETVRIFQTIDVLVNNAGIMDDFVPVDQLSNEQWNRVMGVNLNGPFYACRLAVPHMLKQGSGSIINISSIGGLNGSRAGAAYTTSKHGIIGLTKNIGFMYAKSGIRCNAIAPGGVNTNIGIGMKPNSFGYERCTSGGANMPRMGEANEIASAALFLASSDSSFVNGEVLTVDGGWTAY